MIVIFVHGWSVRDLRTYGQLPARLAEAGGIDVQHVFLSEYVSYRDEVTLDDIARTFDSAIRQRVPAGERFACITHSTGGPVVRTWLDLYYGPERLAQCPMSHLIMLAPANHGSALAQLGKSRLSRTKFFFEGVEPGQRVLDWLELGSAGQWNLNLHGLHYKYAENGVFPFVLTGQSVDRSMYDHLNSYTGEPGSDGVVRVAGANMNYTWLQLEQAASGPLLLKRSRRSPRVAFGILPGVSHSGETIGIMGSVGAGPHPTVEWITRCLNVHDAASYEQAADELDLLTAHTQEQEQVRYTPRLTGPAPYTTDRHSMFTFKLRDDRDAVLDDYDLLLTAGPNYDPDDLPQGFFRDRQRNSLRPGHLTYYVNHDRMTAGLAHEVLEQKLGFRIQARPDSGLAHYVLAELRSDAAGIGRLLRPNETTMIDITLRRSVTRDVFQLVPAA